MAKNNFKAQTAASTDPNYATGVGTAAAPGVATGLNQEAAGAAGLGQVGQKQQNFAQSLQQQAAGTGGPTLADQAVKDVTARNNANAAGFAASSKGLNPALAARQALMAQSGNNQAEAGQAAQTHIQEQQQAQSELGGALSGAAGTEGALAGAGTGLTGTAGGVANSANANLNTGQDSANEINGKIAGENASALNAGIGSVVNAAGGALGLAEGGTVPPRYPKAMAAGGTVPHESVRLAHPRPPQSTGRRSFAAQVAHHLTREYFDDGGSAGVHQEDSDYANARAQETAATTSDLATSSEAAAPKGEKNVQGVDLSEKGKAKPMRANIPDPKQHKFAEGGDVEDDEPDTDEGVDGDEPDMGDNTEYMATGGDTTRTNYKPGLFGLNLGSKIHNLLHPAPAAPAPADPLTQTQGAPLPAGYVPPGASVPAAPMGTVHPETATPPPDQEAHADDQGNLPEGTTSFKSGGPVPGKASVPGNSLKNDTVDAKLSPGEVVLPRTISHDPKKAMSFVQHLSKNGGDGAKTLKDIKKPRKS